MPYIWLTVAFVFGACLGGVVVAGIAVWQIADIAEAHAQDFE